MNHPGDAADSVYERQRLMTIRDDLSRRMQEIHDALDRMSSGRYGECERCGEPIPLERLEALPFARHCITCQEQIDQAGVAQR
jgi:DnaK suppressor protein